MRKCDKWKGGQFEEVVGTGGRGGGSGGEEKEEVGEVEGWPI